MRGPAWHGPASLDDSKLPLESRRPRLYACLVLEMYPRSPAKRRSRTGRVTGASATALALAGLLAGSGQTTQAAQPAPVAQATPVAQAASSSGGLMVVDAGRFVGETTPENARRDGLTVVDLSDDWLPYILSEAPDKPQPLRPYLIDLANGRCGPAAPTRAPARTVSSRRSVYPLA